MKALALAFLAVLLVALFAFSATANPLAGGWAPIQNLKNSNVIRAANFAVRSYNKKSNAQLRLVRVVRGETQVVAGINYRLVLETYGKAGKGYYVAVVWERSWINSMILTSFEPAKNY